MPCYVHPLTVTPAAIDVQGHANNVEFVQWMQDAAVGHANDCGCTAATREDGAAWVVRSHHVEYLLPAFEGDRLEVRTWVADFRRVASRRCYEFVRQSDGAVLAKGETNWVYLDAESGRPRRIPEAIQGMLVDNDGSNKVA